MTKYKDADELLKRLNSCKYPAEKTTKRQVTYNYAISQACRIVDALPAADVVEVRHGRWVMNERGVYECSICGRVPTAEEKQYDRYCSWCGAYMGDTNGL